jgi:hypothetical protein
MDNIMINESGSKRNIFIRIVSFLWAKKSIIVEIIALLFIILFLYTGISKLLDFQLFYEQLNDSPVLGQFATAVSIILPLTEFVVSVLLFFSSWRLKGLYATAALMTLFTGYVIVILSSNEELPCTCGGIISLLSWQSHLVLNTTLLALSILGISLYRRISK